MTAPTLSMQLVLLPARDREARERGLAAAASLREAGHRVTVVQFIPWPPRSAEDVAFLLASCSVADTPAELFQRIAGLSYREKFAVLAGMARDYGLAPVWPSGGSETVH